MVTEGEMYERGNDVLVNTKFRWLRANVYRNHICSFFFTYTYTPHNLIQNKYVQGRNNKRNNNNNCKISLQNNDIYSNE